MYAGRHRHIVDAIMECDGLTRAAASGDLTTFETDELKQIVSSLAAARNELADRDALLEVAMAMFVRELREKRNVKSIIVSRLMLRPGQEPNTSYVTRILQKWDKLVEAAEAYEHGQVIDLGTARLLAAVKEAELASAAAANDPNRSPEARLQAEHDNRVVGTWLRRAFRKANASAIVMPGLLAGVFGQKGGAAAGGAAAGGVVAAELTAGSVAVGTTAGGAVAGGTSLALGAKVVGGTVAAVMATSAVIVASDPTPPSPPPQVQIVAEDQRPTPSPSPRSSRATWPPPPFVVTSPSPSPEETPSDDPLTEPTSFALAHHATPSTTKRRSSPHPTIQTTLVSPGLPSKEPKDPPEPAPTISTAPSVMTSQTQPPPASPPPTAMTSPVPTPTTTSVPTPTAISSPSATALPTDQATPVVERPTAEPAPVPDLPSPQPTESPSPEPTTSEPAATEMPVQTPSQSPPETPHIGGLLGAVLSSLGIG